MVGDGGGIAISGWGVHRMSLKARECGGAFDPKISGRFGLLRARWVNEQNTKK
jgi:hypothetical protein